jgi:hypothetical protein
VSCEGCSYSYCDASCDYDPVAVDNLIAGVLTAIDAVQEDVVTIGLRVERLEEVLTALSGERAGV